MGRGGFSEAHSWLRDVSCGVRVLSGRTHVRARAGAEIPALSAASGASGAGPRTGTLERRLWDGRKPVGRIRPLPGDLKRRNCLFDT